MTITKPEHEVAYQDMVNLVRKHADKLAALELLAIGANMLGKLAAMQDQRITTPSRAMHVIASNVEIGNQQAIEELMKSKGQG